MTGKQSDKWYMDAFEREGDSEVGVGYTTVGPVDEVVVQAVDEDETSLVSTRVRSDAWYARAFEREQESDVGVGFSSMNRYSDRLPVGRSEPRIELGAFIELMRDGRAQSIEMLAEELGLPATELAAIETDSNYVPEAQAVQALAAAFDVSHDKLAAMTGLVESETRFDKGN